MNKIKNYLVVIAMLTTLISFSYVTNVQAAVIGNVSGTMREKSVVGSLTCEEAGHKLSVLLNYDTRSTLTGVAKSHSTSNTVFGNNKNVSQSSVAGTHESMSYLKVTGKVDDDLKKYIVLKSYGTSKMEYW